MTIVKSYCYVVVPRSCAATVGEDVAEVVDVVADAEVLGIRVVATVNAAIGADTFIIPCTKNWFSKDKKIRSDECDELDFTILNFCCFVWL